MEVGNIFTCPRCRKQVVVCAKRGRQRTYCFDGLHNVIRSEIRPFGIVPLQDRIV